MRLLLDECVTRKLKDDLAGHQVSTVVEAGYRGLKNGALLRAAASTFEVLITVDRNIAHQQNIRSHQIAVVILIAGGITHADLKPLVPKVLASLTSIRPGELIRIEETRPGLEN
jgi:predicted nuclease of predicted toxin-antitoxin system